MSELEYREINLRLQKLEHNVPNDFLLGIYTDLVRQHIDLLKDFVHNRFSREDYEDQIRLQNDVKILEKSLSNLNDLLSRDHILKLGSEISDIGLSARSSVSISG